MPKQAKYRFPRPEGNEQIKLELTPAQVREALGEAVPRRALFLAVPMDAPVVGKPDRVWPLYANVRVSAPNAAKYVQDAFGGKFETQALCRVSLLGNCVFLGS